MWATEWFKKWAWSIGEDPTRQGLIGTPERMARAFTQILSGYKEDPATHLQVIFDESLAVDPIEVTVDFTSMCEHHVLPFFGVVKLTYLPARGRIVGLSKIPRAVKCLASRLQTQERLTAEIANAFVMCVDPQWVTVEINAVHMCTSSRGCETQTKMKTTAKRPA